MNNSLNILKNESKANLKSYGISVLIALVSAIVLSFVVWPDYSSYFSAYTVSAATLLIVVTFVFAVTSICKSMSETFPMANKLGFTRKDITKSLLIKDIIIIGLASLMVYGLARYLKVNLNDLASFGENISRAVFLDKNGSIGVLASALKYASIAIIGSSVAYWFGFPEVGGGLISLAIVGVIINEFRLTIDTPLNILVTLVLFIVAQIIRAYIINKTDRQK